MAIDARILLQGVVPNLGEAVQQGQVIGQNIRNAPMIRKINEQKIEQGEQIERQQRLETGRNAALAINSVIGDNRAFDERDFAVIRGLGVNVTDEEAAFNQGNLDRLIRLSEAGKNALATGGASDKAVGGRDTFVQQVGVNDANEPVFQNVTTVVTQGRGGIEATDTPIGPTFTKSQGNPLNAARIARAGGEAASRALGQADVEISTGQDLARVRAEEAKAIKEAQVKAEAQTKASMADIISKTASDLELNKGLGRDMAKRIAEDISKGVVAADGLATIGRAISLLGDVETGGFENFKLRSKQVFGAEGADEAELNNALDRKSTRLNSRGIDAAVKAKDFDKAKQIQEAVDFKFSFEGEGELSQEEQAELQALEAELGN